MYGKKSCISLEVEHGVTFTLTFKHYTDSEQWSYKLQKHWKALFNS